MKTQQLALASLRFTRYASRSFYASRFLVLLTPLIYATRTGNIHTMKIAIDSAGRLVVPKEIRREAGIEAGMPLQIQCRDGRIEIEPAPLPVTLERKGRLLVAVPVRQLFSARSHHSVSAHHLCLTRQTVAYKGEVGVGGALLAA